MTDDEPEPFRTPADPDAEEAAAEEAEEAAADAAVGDVPVVPAESIADLINEAARTAADQAEAEQRGDAPQDRSADVWGEPVDTPVDDPDAVWQQAEDATGSVWDLEEADDAMWGSAGAGGHEQPATDEPAAAPGPTAPPAAAEGMHEAGGGLEPETFTFAVGDGGDTTPAAPVASAADSGAEPDEEPETFTFPAGPSTTAPAVLPDQAGDEQDEPEAFSFAVADDASPGSSQPPAQGGGTSPGADEVDEWTVPGAQAADGDSDDSDVDDDVWTFAVKTDQDTPLADAASPRDDAGWHDLEAEQESGWEVADLTAQAPAASDDEEPADFTAAIPADAYDDEDDDGPWTAPALADEEDALLPGEEEDLPAAHGVTAEVQDALGDLLGNGAQDAVAQTDAATAEADAATAATTPSELSDSGDVASDAGRDDLDHLDDLSDLDHLDDMAAAAVPEVGDDQPPADDADDDEYAAELEQPLDAPTAARQVMEPGSVTFSSSGKKKKRGLFG